MITASFSLLSLLLVLAVAAAVRWPELLDLPARLLAGLRARHLQARLERDLDAWILPVVGVIDADAADAVVDRFHRRRERARPRSGQHLYPPRLCVLIDSPGGACDAAERILRRISSYPGPVIAVVPHRAWSNGTLIATGADELHMGMDANLGACCPIGHIDPTDLHSAAVVRARDQDRTVDQIRATWMQDQAAKAIVDARARRRVQPQGEAAQRLAAALTDGTIGSHWRPIWSEVAREIGFDVMPIAPDHFRRWSDLARACLRALPSHHR